MSCRSRTHCLAWHASLLGTAGGGAGLLADALPSPGSRACSGAGVRKGELAKGLRGGGRRGTARGLTALLGKRAGWGRTARGMRGPLADAIPSLGLRACPGAGTAGERGGWGWHLGGRRGIGPPGRSRTRCLARHASLPGTGAAGREKGAAGGGLTSTSSLRVQVGRARSAAGSQQVLDPGQWA